MTSKRSIRAFLDEADKAFEQASLVTEQRLLQAYRKTLDSIKAKIRDVYADNPTPTMTELRKFNRLVSLQKQIAEEIRKLTQLSVNVTAQSVKNTFLTSYSDTGTVYAKAVAGAIPPDDPRVKRAAGISAQFDRVPKEAMEFAVSDNLWLGALKQANARVLTETERIFETVLRTNARQEIVQGLAQGESYGTVAKAITERFNVAATRAKMIAYTETHKAHSKGRVEGIRRGADAAGRLGLKTMKVWKHNYRNSPGYEPRENHMAADGQAVAVDKPFHVGGEDLEAPGLGSDLANNIYCSCNAQFEILENK